MAFAAFIILTFVFAIVSIALILIILVQRPQGGGLATAFGGAGGGNDTAFGGRTGDALTVATVAGFFVYPRCCDRLEHRRLTGHRERFGAR
jgi:protein translocase SecG subunit